MRSVERMIRGTGRRQRLAAGAAALLLATAAAPRAERTAPIHAQRYAMGTMFDVVAYHTPPGAARAAAARALDEVERLDRVMSHYRPDSELSRLAREARGRFVTVDPSLYDVLDESLTMARRSRGKFDITVGPLLEVWKRAAADGAPPSAREVAEARRCIGHDRIELQAPDRVRVHAGCLTLDLGGIGKGFAVERALRVLAAHGISNALVNAGGSSIAALGAPPGREGWPVRLAANLSGRQTLLLRNESLSTSQQDLVPLALEAGHLGEIIDPDLGAPIASRAIVTVVAGRATIADALSTTLLMLPIDEGIALLDSFPDTAAVWASAEGEPLAIHNGRRLRLTEDGTP